MESSYTDDNTIVQCSTSLNCGGNLSTMTRRQCCVERDDGLAFTIEGDSTCHVCIGKHRSYKKYIHCSNTLQF